jgi:pimeloyl-ACP methyl ester carboxylesterase
VVVGVGHAGFNKTALFPDGFHFVMDTLLPPAGTGELESDARTFWDYLTERVAPVWVDDARFALDRLELLNETVGDFLFGRLDLARVGMVGWSLGGAVSLDASRLDSRVKAAVDLDGQLFGELIEEGTTRPVMLMHGGVPPEPEDSLQRAVFQRLVDEVDGNTATFRERVTHDWYDLTIAGTDHGNFSDLVLGGPALPGRIHPRRAHSIINAYTLAFFERYLKGLNGPLLDGPSDEYPEVEFRSKRD